VLLVLERAVQACETVAVMTNKVARIGQDNRVHILSDGQGGEWKACCSSLWFPERHVEHMQGEVPTCLVCIVEDARWWREMRKCTKPVTFTR
jgi:hypothetical protein